MVNNQADIRPDIIPGLVSPFQFFGVHTIRNAIISQAKSLYRSGMPAIGNSFVWGRFSLLKPFALTASFDCPQGRSGKAIGPSCRLCRYRPLVSIYFSAKSKIAAFWGVSALFLFKSSH
jgi:hypothetical protein